MTGMPVAMTIGPEEAVKLVLKELKEFSAPNKLPPMRNDAMNLKRWGDIDVFFDMADTESCKAIFHFVTADDCELSVTVDFIKLDREYLDRIKYDVRKSIVQHRGKRKGLNLVVSK